MLEKSFSLLFYLKKPKNYRNGAMPIYLRIMLGHKNIKTTQHYAKVLDKKISDDMNLLKVKIQTKDDKQLKAI